MELLYKQEHLSCLNYSHCTDSVVEHLELEKGDSLGIEVSETMIVFSLEGAVKVSYEGVKNHTIAARRILLFPAGSRLNIVAERKSSFVLFRVKQGIQICNLYTLEKLFAENAQSSLPLNGQAFEGLLFNEKIDEYIHHLTGCFDDGLRCFFYLEMKVKELFFLLRAYYPKEELASFFRPLMSNNSEFTNFVWENYRKARNVAHFAEISNYSPSTFKAKFRKVFGVAPTEWLAEQKSRNIYYELNRPGKSIKEISSEYHFASESHMNTFCRDKFGVTPGQIRRMQRPSLTTAKSDQI